MCTERLSCTCPELISARSDDAAGKDKFVDRNELTFRILRRAGDPYL